MTGFIVKILSRYTKIIYERLCYSNFTCTTQRVVSLIHFGGVCIF